MTDLEALYHCMCLLSGGFTSLLEQQQTEVDAIFVWGRAADEFQPAAHDDGILELAASLHHRHGCPVAIPGYTGTTEGQTENGYPGPSVWRPQLEAFGVLPDMIRPVPGTGSNTKAEMEDFLAVARQSAMKRVIGVTQLPHALRAMLGTVKSLATQEMRDLQVIPLWPLRFNWQRETHGSQGEGPYPRLRWADEEWGRIPRYQRQDDLASFTELVEYLTSLH